MRTGIDDTVLIHIVRKICVCSINLTVPLVNREGKLENLHSGKIVLIPESLHIRGDHAKVLCDDGKVVTEFLSEGRKQFTSRTWNPLSVHCGSLSCRNLPAGGKAPEVVYSYDITEG